MTPADGDTVGSTVVATDVPCVGCRYNLRGQPVDRLCPECGRAVADSTRGDLLRHASAAWLGRLRAGVVCMGVGLLSLLATGVLLMLAFGHAYGPRLGMPYAMLSTVGWLLYPAGAWVLATPGPELRRHERVRSFIRVAVALGLADRASGFLPTARWTPAGVMVDLVAREGVGAVTVAGVWATLWYLNRLSRRLPEGASGEGRPADQAETVMIGLGTSLAMLWILNAASLVPRLTGGRRLVGAGAVNLASMVCGVAATAFTVLYAVLLARLARRLGTEAAAARAMRPVDPAGSPGHGGHP